MRKIFKLLVFLTLFIKICFGIVTDIRCMNFYGLETPRRKFVCDWQHNSMWYLERLKYDLFINTIRVPFSFDYVHKSDLRDLDKMMHDCSLMNLRVILDYHRTFESHQSPAPDAEITLNQFLETWYVLLERYKNEQSLFGIGIFNEIQENNAFQYANTMHSIVIDNIEKRYPNKYFYFAGCPNWGGNCQYMNLTGLSVWNRTYIEVHKYIFSGDSTEMDWDRSIPNTIDPAHYFVGEFGWRQGDVRERNWGERFISYLRQRNIKNACAWTIAHSGDTEGWWRDDCETFNWEKASLLTSLWFGEMKRNRLRFERPYNQTTFNEFY